MTMLVDAPAPIAAGSRREQVLTRLRSADRPLSATDVATATGVAFDRGATRTGDGTIWSTDGATPERTNGYTAAGAVHVLQARDGTLRRLAIGPVDTTNPGDAVPPVRPVLAAHPAGRCVADSLHVIAGPYQARSRCRNRTAAGRR